MLKRIVDAAQCTLHDRHSVILKAPHEYWYINASQNDSFIDLNKFKAFADDKLNVAKIMISVFDRVENTVGKGENAGYQHFLLFPQYFPKLSSLRSSSRDCVVKG